MPQPPATRTRFALPSVGAVDVTVWPEGIKVPALAMPGAAAINDKAADKQSIALRIGHSSWLVNAGRS
jgi:hypothetical protein